MWPKYDTNYLHSIGIFFEYKTPERVEKEYFFFKDTQVEQLFCWIEISINKSDFSHSNVDYISNIEKSIPNCDCWFVFNRKSFLFDQDDNGIKVLKRLSPIGIK